MENTSALSPQNLRWTYDGTLDDKLGDYPWPEIPAVKIRFDLDRRLFESVVTGSPLLLNDGYLIFNAACRKSLDDQDSPLRLLIRKNYVKVLMRKPTLLEMLEEGSKQGMRNRTEALENSDLELKHILDAVQKELNEHNTTRWPHVDISIAFRELVNHLHDKSTELLATDGVPIPLFRNVVDTLNKAMRGEPFAARTKWETITKEVVAKEGGTEHDISSLMHLANELYHHNFAIALQARPTEAMGKNCQIAVRTRISSALSKFSKTHTAAQELTSVVPEVLLPKNVDYSDIGLFLKILDEDSSIAECRREYLRLRDLYRAGSKPFDEMEAMHKEYQRKLYESLAVREPAPVTEVMISSGLMLGAGHLFGGVIGSTPEAIRETIVVVLDALRETYVKNIVEKWRFLSIPERLVRHSLAQFTTRSNLTSMLVDPQEASKLVAPLPYL